MKPNQFQIISAGEVQAGMLLTVFEVFGLQRPTSPNIFGNPEETEGDLVFQRYNNPWLKGVPFKVIGVSLPIVMVETNKAFSKVPVSPVLFFDARYCSFLEVSKKYYKTYLAAHQEAAKVETELNIGSPTFVALKTSNLEEAPRRTQYE